MGRRTNPIGLRIGRFLDWSGNVQNPVLSSYIKHIFQHCLVNEPAIRATTDGYQVSVTLFKDKMDPKDHPRVQQPYLDFSGVDFRSAMGYYDKRINSLAGSHFYYKNIFKKIKHKNLIDLMQAKGMDILPKRVDLHVNVIDNPLLNADILAQKVAKELSDGQQLTRVYKNILKLL